MMNYKIEMNKVKDENSNLKALASVVFGDVFKVTGVALKEGKNGYFLDFPSYKTSQKKEDGTDQYNNFFNPITSEFAQELKDNMVQVFESDQNELYVGDYGENLKIEASAHPFTREDSLKGVASLYIEDVFVAKNFSIREGDNGLYINNPSMKTKKTNEDGSPQYRDVAYPVTKEARENIYDKIFTAYKERELSQQPDKPKTR